MIQSSVNLTWACLAGMAAAFGLAAPTVAQIGESPVVESPLDLDAPAAPSIIDGDATSTTSTTDQQPDRQVRRFNPATRELDPVPLEDVQPGKIYNHYDAQLGRRVWAFAETDGKFGYALGPGSTEAPQNFDIAGSVEQTRALIEEAAPAWLERARTLNRAVLVRLGADGKWSLLEHASIRSHYVLATQRRWEFHGNRRVAVRHSGGYEWIHDGRWYQPASSFGGRYFGALGPASGTCLCHP